MARNHFISPFLLILIHVTLFLVSSCSAGWVLEDDYTPSNFFSMFSFFTASDPTHGTVSYVSEATAQTGGLINTNNDKVYMGVDHTNVTPNGRPSVRLTSNKSYNAGTLMILDLEHMPVGYGAWPAFWTVGPNWPAGGEIDIIEGVNYQTQNYMTLHTAEGCSITNNGGFTGAIDTPDCYVYASGQYSNAGCSIHASGSDSYGAPFNAIGGGVYAMAWTSSDISVWFFPRGSIPSDITSGTITQASWGTPQAKFSGSCNIPQFFQNHQIVFDTTFCGDWAGAVWDESGAESSQYPTCANYVTNNPSAFKDAYWSINSLKVYTVSTSTSDSTTSSSVDVPATTTESQSDNNNQENDNDNDNNTTNDNDNNNTTNDNNNNSSTDNDDNNSTTNDNNVATTSVTVNSVASQTVTNNVQGTGTAVVAHITGDQVVVPTNVANNNDGGKNQNSHASAGNSGTQGSTGTSAASSSSPGVSSSSTGGSSSAVNVVNENGILEEESPAKLKAREYQASQAKWTASLRKEKKRHQLQRRHVRPVGGANAHGALRH